MKARFWVLAWGVVAAACGGRSLTTSNASAGAGGSAGSLSSSGGSVATLGGSSSIGTGFSGDTSFSGTGTCPTCPGLLAGVCAEFETDVANCGSCGHQCAGDVCRAGVCPTGSGGTRIAAATTATTALAVDANSVYWLDNTLGTTGQPTTVKSCPLSGCVGEPITLWQSASFLTFLTVGGGSLWSVSGQTVLSCPVSGCLASGPTLLATQPTTDNFITTLATSDLTAAWGTNGGAYACSLGGCPKSGPSKLFDSLGTEAGFAIIGTNLYGVNIAADNSFGLDQKNNLFDCPLTGCTASPPVLGNIETAGALAFDADHAYYIDPGTSDTAFAGVKPVPPTSWADGGVYQCPLSGCGTTPAALALYTTWFAATAIAADASGVYWTVGESDGTLSGGSSTLVRCSADGCGAQPAALATLVAGSARAIALSAKNVYWIDPGVGAIMMLAK